MDQEKHFISANRTASESLLPKYEDVVQKDSLHTSFENLKEKDQISKVSITTSKFEVK